jgi:hypothetical protein
LQFFFKNLRDNRKENEYCQQFPFVSLCGHERNYLRCDDLPFVVTKLDKKLDMIQINQITAAQWMFYFDPMNLYHNLQTGRLYYNFEKKEIITNHANEKPTRFTHIDKLPCKLALVKSEISIDLMKTIKRTNEENDKEDPVLKFEYKSKVYDLNSSEKSRAHELLTLHSQFKEDSETN